MLAVRRLGILIYRSVKAYFDDGCGQRAAAISYYVLFSIFPLVIFSVGILGLVLRDSQLQSDLVDNIMQNIPLSQDEGRSDVTDALRQVANNRSGAIGLLGLVGLVWSSSAMFGVVRSSLNMVFRAQNPRPIVLQKLLDMLFVLAVAPFFVGSVVATSALRYAQATSKDLSTFGDITDALGPGFWVASVILPIIVSWIAFFLVYWVIPARHIKAKYIWPGALLAAMLFELVKIGFSVYIEHFTSYDVVFGSLGAVVAFLFWVYLSANILLLGAELTSQLPDVMAGFFDTPRPSNKPRRTLTQKVLRLLRSLVLRPRDEETEKQRDGNLT